MGNFSSKDGGHGPTGAHGDSFHTPPVSPQSEGPGVPQFPYLNSPQRPSTAPGLSPGQSPPLTSSGRQTQASIIPSTLNPPQPPPEWRPHPPVNSNSSTAGSGGSSAHAKAGSNAGIKGHLSVGKNGGPPSSTPGGPPSYTPGGPPSSTHGAPPSSTPRTPVSEGTSVALSPTQSPSSLGSVSPVEGRRSGESWKERDSGLSQSLVQGQEGGDELEKLLEESRLTLGISDDPEGTSNTREMVRHLLTEVKTLRNTLQMERGEWVQFQADLQVAVAVADRLRAEAEEELTALRTAHKDTERELSAAQQRQKEADVQLVTLRGELRDSRHTLATLTQTQGRTDPPHPNHRSEKRSGEPTASSDNKRETHGDRLGREGGGPTDVRDEDRTQWKGVTQRYLQHVTNEERNGEEGRSSDPRRTGTTERSRSLSRLPPSSDVAPTQKPASQSNSSTTAGTANKNMVQLKVRRSLDWPDGKPSSDAGKREESLNKYNSALTELPPTKSQDGFNLLLRRHGGSKRNSLLRWCQNRTHGYKNIDITNFSSSWADGLAFCAVYHTYLPSHIPYSSLAPENKRENLSLAFKTGASVGIPQSLTVEEMLRAGGPDWQRVLGYVEAMYRHFEM